MVGQTKSKLLVLRVIRVRVPRACLKVVRAEMAKDEDQWRNKVMKFVKIDGQRDSIVRHAVKQEYYEKSKYRDTVRVEGSLPPPFVYPSPTRTQPLTKSFSSLRPQAPAFFNTKIFGV